jgi:hypothetical protein
MNKPVPACLSSYLLRHALLKNIKDPLDEMKDHQPHKHEANEMEQGSELVYLIVGGVIVGWVFVMRSRCGEGAQNRSLYVSRHFIPPRAAAGSDRAASWRASDGASSWSASAVERAIV